jgi:hypothetical protein
MGRNVDRGDDPTTTAPNQKRTMQSMKDPPILPLEQLVEIKKLLLHFLLAAIPASCNQSA